jgi:carboxyl-terminal processing protease
MLPPTASDPSIPPPDQPVGIAAAPPPAPPTAPPPPARASLWMRRGGTILALVLVFVVGLGIGRVGSSPDPFGGILPGASPSGSLTPDQEFALIRQAWDILHTKYVGRADLDDQALVYAAINGMTVAVGDTGHTNFLTAQQLADQSQGLSGSFVGIGVRIDPAADGRPKVVGVFDDSPAKAAGIKAGDIIEAVDGKSTTGHTLDDVSSWIRGDAGTTVKVTVRAGSAKARVYTITRANVATQVVTWTMVPGTKTAFIRLDEFSTGAADATVAALKAIKEAGATRIIFDLRGNPGGYVNEAVGIASQFIASGNVYIERDADGHETTHPVSPGGVATDIPLVLLVDETTASSAEIVSGALQDAKRATIVGVKTYGTGTVLGDFPLADGSALRVGTVEWLTPDGRRIWHAGITPDVVVERPSDVAALIPDDIRDLTTKQVAAIKDPQLARAITVAAGLDAT